MTEAIELAPFDPPWTHRLHWGRTLKRLDARLFVERNRVNVETLVFRRVEIRLANFFDTPLKFYTVPPKLGA